MAGVRMAAAYRGAVGDGMQQEATKRVGRRSKSSAEGGQTWRWSTARTLLRHDEIDFKNHITLEDWMDEVDGKSENGKTDDVGAGGTWK